ncbi:hypothetical protein UREG_01143 [Uncinocarpus reesii 1704]|uniref:glucan 1,3-beta-glucosidase n=1 Tax=Uncinocarpus reesii (strain UAMH 1704) TaxID=336963 RepID=C4JGF2_UNCRE|nr:uncharacterized protein UREG_01143 [Uncinocarpus reesii 1704]EEP76294.1 hypothetical protein UREG_01143 [Uncinocarpus reesii 1704]
MPHRSRDRHRGYEPEWQHQREASRHRYRDNRDDYDYNHDDIIDAEEKRYAGPGRQRSRHHGESRLRSHRRYDPHDRYEDGGIEDDEDDDYDDDDEDEEESEIIVVDSRPNFARPPNVRPSPRRITPPPYISGRERSRHHKAKESPATSPVKKRDRERDREGHRRRRDSTADDDAHARARLRDRAAREKYREKDIADARARSRDEPKRSRHWERERVREKHASSGSANSATQLLSANALSKLNEYNAKRDATERQREARDEKARREKEKRRRKKEGMFVGKGRDRDVSRERGREKSKKRLVSGAMMEEGRGPELRVRGGGRHREKERDDGGGGKWYQNWSKKKKIWVIVGIVALLLIIIIPIGVVVSNKKNDTEDSPGRADSDPPNDNLKDIDRSSIPENARGTYLDPFTWYDTTDFNVTFTDETVGGLPIMGLNSAWDDSTRANDHVPPLDKSFPYGKQPIRGVNVGGWLSIEPFITPSFFERYSAQDGVVDEYTLTKRLGSTAKATLEKHYATFITEASFRQMRDAGLDHVRIPYSYWMVKTFDDDPYVEQVAWRYLLRAIEYCRKYGLRVKLDMHGVPGSQNGWNHSGRQGAIGWLNGTDGDKNAQRALDIHDQLSKFFAQPRYKNVVTIYGLANEPLLLKLDIEPVLDWTKKAAEIVSKNGMKQYIVFGDGFLKLSKWKTILQDTGYNFLLDTHQYTIFNTALVSLTHKKKLEFVCDGWVELISESNSKNTGWGPIICGEWSQADTDCAKYLNNVNVGTRWTGTMDSPTAKDQVFKPLCPNEDKSTCSCDGANADPSNYSDEYKKFLQTYAEAQMSAFEKGWGWFYWTWETESAVQWSWRRGLEAGILPKKAYEPTFKCGDDFPDLGNLPEYY